MDRLIYTALSGAKAAFARQEVAANNLANASTAGFRAEVSAYAAVPVQGAPARAFAVDEPLGADFRPGPIQRTGRELDVAIEGSGWLAVESSEGTEAYTRGGALEVGPDGVLRTASGRALLSDAGPIAVAPGARLSIASDGTVSATTPGTGASAPVGRIKLVDPAGADLARGADGLFRLRDGAAAERDERVRLAPGALEGSNVNPVEAMVTMIALARQFELHMKMLASEEANAQRGAQLLNISA